MNNSISTVNNAIILAAGFASRFVPLSLETPKGLLKVHGEVLIERQIRQLKEAGISEIIVVTGYKQEKFQYLADTFDIKLVHNSEFDIRNNHSSIWAVRNYLSNSYICSSDNYFAENVFSKTFERPYYSALYSDGPTNEYCLTTDDNDLINGVSIGGSNSWYMLGHVLWDNNFSQKFLTILEAEYNLPVTTDRLWEQIYMEHLAELKLYIKKYNHSTIYEFDSLDELCLFDSSYVEYRDSLAKNYVNNPAN